MPAKFVRSASLTAELTALIDAKIATGHDRRASKITRAALRLPAVQDSCAQRDLDKKLTDGCHGG